MPHRRLLLKLVAAVANGATMPYAWLREPAVVAPAIAIGLEALLEVQRDAVVVQLGLEAVAVASNCIKCVRFSSLSLA